MRSALLISGSAFSSFAIAPKAMNSAARERNTMIFFMVVVFILPSNNPKKNKQVMKQTPHQNKNMPYHMVEVDFVPHIKNNPYAIKKPA